MEISWTFFIAALAFGGLASLCYYLAVWRLTRKGIRVRLFATPSKTFRVFRQYRELAAEDRWPPWPISGFWLFSLLAFACMAAFAYVDRSHRAERGVIPPQWLSTGAAHLWAAATSLVIALAFSYRVFQQTSTQGTKLTKWKVWTSDEFTRNDFYLAALGWLGFLIASLTLVLR